MRKIVSGHEGKQHLGHGENNAWDMREPYKVLPENGVIRRGHIEDNLNNFYNK